MNKKIIVALLPLLGLASCSQESSFNGDEERFTGEPKEIVLSAGFGEIGGSVIPDTRGAVNSGSGLTVYLVRRDKNTSADSWPAYPNTALTATRTGGSGNTSLAFAATQYYPMEKLFGDNSSTSYNDTRFIGWYPQGTGLANGKVTLAMNGKDDILLSNEVTGSYTNQFTSGKNQLAFEHQLAQITVQVKAADTDAPTRWGKVTAVSVKSQPATCDITLPTTGVATVGWTGTGNSFSLENMTQRTLTTGYQECGKALVKPGDTTVTLSVTTEKGGPRDVPVTLAGGSFTKGTAYTVSLDFKSTTIAPSATISDWTPATSNPSADL